MRAPIAVLSLALSACAPPPVDDTLTEPTPWLFGHFTDREDEVAAQAGALADFAATVAWPAPPTSRTYAPERLAEAHTDDVDAPPLPEGALTVALVTRSEHDLSDHQEQAGVTARDALGDPTVTTWTRAFDDGAACFPVGLCDDAVARDDVARAFGDATLGLAWLRQLRTVQLDDGREVLLERAWLAAPPEVTGPAALTVWFELSLWAPDPEDLRRTWRLHATWTDLSLPDDDAGATLLEATEGAFEAQERALSPAPP